MGWPYRFIDLSTEEVQLRRETLDRYGAYAHYSALAPIVLALLVRLGSYLRRRWQQSAAYDAVPDSPVLKERRQSWSGNLEAKIRKGKWWLDDDVYFMGQHWGQKDQWVFGLAWASWLLVLSVLETGDDYLHITKRFGIIVASQIPFQYLLALKSFSPIAKVFGTSHEELNKWHRVLSRVTLSLLVLHVMFYLNFFVAKGLVQKRLFAPIVFAGVVAFATMNMMTSTAAAAVRRYSYRIFFVTHLVGAFAVPPLVFFHAKSARLFMAKALVVFLIDIVVRRLRTVTAPSKLETVPGTNLVKISASIPQDKVNAFCARPGSHIYLSVPPAARSGAGPMSSKAMLFEFLFNPFTVAAVDEEAGNLTLVARELDGPLTKHLGRFANAGTGTHDNKVPLCLEGPYGAASLHFDKLISHSVDRVLLIAGGVGATFTIPIYQAILQDNPNTKVDLVWSVRSAGDVTWAMSAGKSTKSVLDDPNVQIYYTGDALDSDATGPMAGLPAETNPEGEMEMSAISSPGPSRNRLTSQQHRKRPDLRKIIDDVFKKGAEERIAVLVCGPSAMGREVREYVGAWVMRGREVVWHNEGFGW
ncbi:ferric reductase like transmembrane component [Colletotrichum graminicola]|uniref:Ferric reductase like transmembrane component n=1 Tax=Colletotrichum graminicola (strain M1.001 / M2 / FGSC 10212) TaxID=645133 RepID=E3QLJ8_COLGM|nr:ferric reductase like transmembrane component [Colletotrichum graminicola M1.001]EFQ31736.1 ferric reductase like transmembrane component [Colletotrichum graminicola M1.001]WDK13480.1 ferric reductase like transmembrane component [Colletotrichum graminicola]